MHARGQLRIGPDATAENQTVINFARWAYRGLISATMFRGPVGMQPPASRTHVTPRNG